MSKAARKPSGLVIVVLIVLGLVMAGFSGSEFGRVLLGALLGVVLAQLYSVRHGLRDLRSRFNSLEQQVSRSAVAEPAPPAAAAPVTVPPPTVQQAPVFAAARQAADRAGPAPPHPTPTPAPAPARPALPPLPPLQPSWLDRAADAALAWLKGGNLLARAGVLTLFVGGSFLAKYAAEHSLFPIELRMAALGAGALVLLGAGWRLRGRQPVYAQTLQGGGIAGFYLTVFAAMRLYHLLPQTLALGLLVVVALCAAILAVAQNALALAVIGTGGGFLAPILVSTGGGGLAALFTYYTVLNLGVFAVAWFRAWRVLNLVGFVFTFGVAGLFRAGGYTAQQQPTMEFFLWLFFLLYCAVSVLFSLRQKPDLKGYISGSLVFGLPLATFSLHVSVIGHEGLDLAWSALGLAVFYLVLATALFRTRTENLRLLVEAFAALGLIFATLAVPMAFDRHATASAWAVEGAGMVWLGMRQQRRLARAFGLLLQLFAGLSYAGGVGEADPLYPVFNGSFLGGLTVALAGLGSGLWLFRNRSSRAWYESGFDHAALLWGIAWWLGSGLHEIGRWLPPWHLGACLAFAAFSAVLGQWGGSRLCWPMSRRLALALLPLAAFEGCTAALVLHHPAAEAAWLGWPLLLGALWWTLWRFEREPDQALQDLLPWLHAGGALLLCLLAAWECSWQIDQQIGGVWPLLPWALVPALGLALLGGRSLRPAWPLARHPQAYCVFAAVPLVLWGVLWIVGANLFSDGDPGELPYLPVLNPLDLSTLLLFLAMARYWTALGAPRRAEIAPQDPRLLPGTAAALVFLWLNAALIRAMHYMAGTPLDWPGIAHSITVEAAVSILWGLLAFGSMTLAARRGQRALWLAGGGLMAVLLLKLFLVDTAGRGTLARIVSFLIVGALLLVTGYLSPLPPEKPAQAPTDPVP
jgi:uncharacterized membrane protein